MSNQTSIPSRCIFPHAGPGPPVLNILPFSPSSSSGDLLQLLGESKDSLQQLICSGHPYVFNLGGGKYLPPSDCDKVADVLLERNLPKVHKNTQRETCFVPETFLPTIPLAVDTEAELGGRLSSLSVEDKKKLGVNSCLKTQVAGDRLEERLYKALKAHPENLGLVIQGGCMRSPGGTSRGEHSEHDFLIVNPRLKYILAIECKRTLNGKAIYGGKGFITQLQRVKERLEAYLGGGLSACWRFVGMVYYEEELERGRAICSKCDPFAIKGEKEVSAKLSQLSSTVQDLLRKERGSLQTNQEDEEYKKIVRTLLFLISAKPSPTPCLLQKEVYTKIVGEKGVGGKKDKIGQGSLSSVMFWTSAQAEIMFNPDLQFVVFLGPWSVGKTLCMREKARQLALEDPNATINFCILVSDIANDSLLYLATKALMSDLPNVLVSSLSTTDNNLMNDLKTKVESSLGDWFFDEVMLPGEYEHKNVASQLTDLVKRMKNEGRRLWITVAGMGNPANLDPEYLKNFLFALKGRKGKGKKVAEIHLPDLVVPLRSCLSVLEQAGLKSGASKTVGVSSGYGGQANVAYRITPNLMEGTPSTQLENKSRGERVEMVTKARDMMRLRMGERGVPVLLSKSLTFCDKEDMEQLKDILVGLGGTSKTLCNLSHPPIKDMQIVENLCDIVETGEAGVKVVDWLERREKGEEERDMVTDLDVARGWEVDAAIVIVSKENKTWENAVMRVVSHVIVIRNF